MEKKAKFDFYEQPNPLLRQDDVSKKRYNDEPQEPNWNRKKSSISDKDREDKVQNSSPFPDMKLFRLSKFMNFFQAISLTFQARHKRMFGNLLMGTLKKFKQDGSRPSDKLRDQKKRQVEQKIEELTKKDYTRKSPEKSPQREDEEMSEEMKQKTRELYILKVEIERTKEFELWEKHKRMELKNIQDPASDEEAAILQEIQNEREKFEKDLEQIKRRLLSESDDQTLPTDYQLLDAASALKKDSTIVKFPVHKRFRDPLPAATKQEEAEGGGEPRSPQRKRKNSFT